MKQLQRYGGCVSDLSEFLFTLLHLGGALCHSGHSVEDYLLHDNILTFPYILADIFMFIGTLPIEILVYKNLPSHKIQILIPI